MTAQAVARSGQMQLLQIGYSSPTLGESAM